MKYIIKRKCVIIVILSLIISVVSTSNSIGVEAESKNKLSNPTITYPTINNNGISQPTTDSEGNTVWDTIYFGNYWQNDTNGDGIVNTEDDKQPIRWRVLSVNSDKVLLIADQNLCKKKYNNITEEDTEVTWETCSLRTWLNDTFLNEAFTENEQKLIADTELINNDTIGIEHVIYDENLGITTPTDIELCGHGGNNTTDKIYLFSLDEIKNPSYGFVRGTDVFCEYSGQYWLRSPGYYNDSYNMINTAANVDYDRIDDSGENVNAYLGVRPVLNLKLSPDNAFLWTQGYSTNRYKDIDETTWDCIYFGHYWQNDTNKDGIADKNDAMEAIKWRVLSVDGDDAFLLSDQVLDYGYYDEYVDTDKNDQAATWETCTLRSWLNNDFYNVAFSSKEQSAIRTTRVVNEDNPYYNTNGGNNTDDKLYILSYNEILNSDYGFPSYLDYPRIGASESDRPVIPARSAKSTAYVKNRFVSHTDINFNADVEWYLRTPGYSLQYITYLGVDGYVWGVRWWDALTDLCFGHPLYDFQDSMSAFREYGIRPVLHLDLSSSTWTYAGTINTKNESTNVPSTIPEPIQATSKPTISAPPDMPASKPIVPPEQQPETPPSVKFKTPAKIKILTAKNKRSRSVTLSWKKTKNAFGYEIRYARNKKFKSCRKRTIKKTTTTFKNLTKKKTYYFKVRAFSVSQNKVQKKYGKWSSVKKIRIKK